MHKTLPSAFALNYLGSYLVDGLMHGTHWGSFFTYASFTYFSQVDKLLVKHVQLHDAADSWGCFFRRLAIGLLGNLNINYMFMAYTMQPWMIGLMAWAEMGFAFHLLGIALWVILLAYDWMHPGKSVTQHRRPRRPLWMFAVDGWRLISPAFKVKTV